MKTLEVPAKLYDEALAFCNERLREKGMPEITELPAGDPMEPTSCPCSKACGARVWGKFWDDNSLPNLQPGMDGYNGTEGAPREFVAFFDDKCADNGLVGYSVLPIRKAD